MESWQKYLDARMEYIKECVKNGDSIADIYFALQIDISRVKRLTMQARSQINDAEGTSG